MIELNDDAFKTTLKETSKDDSDKNNVVYMTNSSLIVTNFDLVKTKYTNSLKLSEENAASVDAFVPKGDNVYFIEFKNGKLQASDKRNVRDKVRDSLLIYNDINNITITENRNSAIFILVYNEAKNKNKSDPVVNPVMKLANQEKISFGMDRFKNLFFKEVHTYTEAQFEEFLQNTLEV